MTLFETQVASGIVLFVGALLSGCLPVLLRFKWRCCAFLHLCTADGPRNKTISFLLCFAAGALLSTALLQLLPAASRLTIGKETFSNISSKSTDGGHSHSRVGNESSHHHHNHHHNFPLPEFIALCSFFVIYFIEVLLLYVLERSGAQANPRNRTKFCSCSQRNIECSRIYKPEPVRAETRKRSATWSEPLGHNRKFETHGCQPDLLRSNIAARPFPNYGTVTAAEFEPLSLQLRVDGITLVNRPVSSPSQLPGIPEIPNNAEELHTSISLTTVISVAALSFQALFEGFAIGAQRTTASTWNLLLAVAIRKFLIIFAVSIQAVVEGCKLAPLIVCVFVFALISPASLAVILSLTSENEVLCWVPGIINSIATGTFLYVTFFEVYPLHSKSSSYRHLKFVGKTMGAAVMVILQYTSTSVN